MYRWALGLHRRGDASEASREVLLLRVPPRGAAFTLRCLMHLGHPIHLALIDAYLRGEVPFPPGTGLGLDSRAILANLVGPMVTLYAAGRERASLLDVVLLPDAPASGGGSRLLVPNLAAVFAYRTAVGLPAAGDDTWRQAIEVTPRSVPQQTGVQVADPPAKPLWVVTDSGASDLGVPELWRDPDGVAALRQFALSRFGRAVRPARRAVEVLVSLVAPTSGSPKRRLRVTAAGLLDAARAELALLERSSAPEPIGGRLDSAAELGRLLRRLGEPRHRREGACRISQAAFDVALVPDVDHGATLSLLPDGASGATAPLGIALDVAWLLLAALLELPLDERRTERIELQLVGAERTTELHVGESLVLPRNRRVFAAWVGSDGRILIRLLPGDSSD